MARTRIIPADVINASAKASNVHSAVMNVALGISLTRGGVDGQILNSNGIGARLENARSQVEQLGNKIGTICQTVENGAILYQSIEANVIGMGRQILGVNVKQTGTEANSYAYYFTSQSSEISKKGNLGTDLFEHCLQYADFELKMISCILDTSFAGELISKGLIFCEHTDTSGKIFLSLKNINKYTKKELAEVLKNDFSEINWTNYDVRRFINDGIPIYNKSGSKTSEWKKISDKIVNEIKAKDGLDFIECVEGLKNQSVHGKIANVGKNFKKSFERNIKDGFGIDYDGSTTASKTLGILGTGLTAVTDIYDNIYNEDIGEWVFTPQTITGTLTDFTIDLSFGAASSAAGAAIGSFFLPPVGTIVGAAAGMAADYVINNVGIFDCDGDGKKDSAVDVAKKSVDSVLKDMFNW